MKALSILQPWASLIVLGHKRIETRSWNTKYRGPLLIHASKPRAKRESLGADFANHYHSIGMWHEELPFGAIVGMVNMVDTFRTDDIVARGWSDYLPSHLPGRMLTRQERTFGDYSTGRYGWLLSEPLLFPEPIPCKGALGIWNVPEELMPEVETQIRKAKTLIV